MANRLSVDIPLHDGLLGPHVDTSVGTTLVGSYPVDFTIDQLTIGFLLGGAPTSGGVTVRIGRNITGVANVDYVSRSFTAAATAIDIGLKLDIGDSLIFTIFADNSSASAADLVGSILISEDFTGISGELYTTKGDVKKALNIDALDLSHDDDIDAVIEQVSRLFDQIAQQPFAQKTFIEFHDGWTLRNGIALNRMPSELLTDRQGIAVTENDIALTFEDDWTIDVFPSRTIYRLDGNGSANGSRFARGERNIKVTYKTAYFAIPGNIVRACRDESVRAWKVGYNIDGVAGDARIGLNSRTETTGTVFDFAEDNLSLSTLRALEPYRRGHYVI